jgi:transposase-like protein
VAGQTRRTTATKKRLFLEAFAQAGTITQAAKSVGINRDCHYSWLSNDPEYGLAFDDAQEQAIERLEAEMLRRGVEGVEEPVFHGGVEVGTIRRYSDTLLIFALKGLRPERYRERISIVTEESVDAEIRRLTAELERRRAQADEAPAAATTEG